MRLINADVFHRIFGIYAEELWAMSQNEMLHWIRSKTDIDAVPVVRCKECKHSREVSQPFGDDILFCLHLFGMRFVRNTFFCANGEG